MDLKIGQPVKQIVKPIAGRIMDIQYNKGDGCLQHLVECAPDEEGHRASYWLNAGTIELDAEQQALDDEARAAAEAEAKTADQPAAGDTEVISN